MPPNLQTERDALEAGTVGWDGQLFSGNPSMAEAAGNATDEGLSSQTSSVSSTIEVEVSCAMVTRLGNNRNP